MCVVAGEVAETFGKLEAERSSCVGGNSLPLLSDPASPALPALEDTSLVDLFEADKEDGVVGTLCGGEGFSSLAVGLCVPSAKRSNSAVSTSIVAVLLRRLDDALRVSVEGVVQGEIGGTCEGTRTC